MADGHCITEAILKEALVNKLDIQLHDIHNIKFDLSSGDQKDDNVCCELSQINLTAKIRGQERKFIFMAKYFPRNEFDSLKT